MVGGDTAGDNQRAASRKAVQKHIEGMATAVVQDVAGGALEGRAKIGNIAILEIAFRQLFDGLTDFGLQPGKRKIAARPATHGPGQIEAFRIAVSGPCLDCGAAGIPQSQHFRRLIESLTQGVVNGGAEAAVASNPLDRQQLAMAAGNQ